MEQQYQRNINMNAHSVNTLLTVISQFGDNVSIFSKFFRFTAASIKINRNMGKKYKSVNNPT